MNGSNARATRIVLIPALIAEYFKRTGMKLPRLALQVNCGDEPQNSGFSWREAQAALDLTRDHAMDVIGIMGIPPKSQDPRPHFRAMRRLADQHHLPRCFMGMSADFPITIDCGATDLRIGRAAFGQSEAVLSRIG